MKTKTLGILIVMLTLLSGSLHAAPEQISIKKDEKRLKERQAKSMMKNIDLRDIEDPAARQAIQQIVEYLGLQTKTAK